MNDERGAGEGLDDASSGSDLAAQWEALARRGVFYSVRGANAAGREAAVIAALTARADAIDAENFCNGYSAVTDPEEPGPVIFTCKCGRLSGKYPDHKTANTLLDAHLDQQAQARQTFADVWRATHAPWNIR